MKKEEKSNKEIEKNEEKIKKVKAKKEESEETLYEGVKTELKKVKWPTGKELVKYTLATLIFCVFLALFFQAIDLLATFIKGLF